MDVDSVKTFYQSVLYRLGVGESPRVCSRTDIDYQSLLVHTKKFPLYISVRHSAEFAK